MSTASSLIKWSKYIPFEPSPKQLAFLMLPQREALYGGGLGGGKSFALLMAALQYVDVPGYSGIILRKNITDLEQPKALLNLAHSWLDEWYPEVKFIPKDRAFLFPSGATLRFGFIGEVRTQDRYQGAEYHFVAFDELTQHIKADYEWMNTRIRRGACDKHPDFVKGCKPCEVSRLSAKIPLRLRGATNPGGIGHLWVKNRFSIQKNEAGHFVGMNPKRPFIQAFVADNPYLGQQEYVDALQDIDPVTRAVYLEGNWEVNEMGRFKQDWAQYYRVRGDYYLLNEPILLKDCFIFSTVDPAASLKTGVAGISYKKDREASWSVISTWAITPNSDLIWLDIDRFQKEAPDIIKHMKRAYTKWKPAYFAIEQNGPGLPVCQLAERAGLPTKRITTIRDKVSNAGAAQNRMEAGKVWLPEEAFWRKDLEDELFNWTGQEHEMDDQIDTLSNAAHETASRFASHEMSELGIGMYTADAGPFWV